MGFNQACLDIDDQETFDNAFDGSGNLTGELTLTNSILDCQTNFEDDTAANGEPYTADEFFSKNMGNTTADPLLEAPYDKTSPKFVPSTGSPATTMSPGMSDPFFEAVDFIGGVGPDDDWTEGWTTTAPN